MAPDPSIRLDDATGCGSSYVFGGRVATLVAMDRAEVVPLLAEVDAAAQAGRYAVGFVAYEAASALNADLPSQSPQEGLPLAWFALFEQRILASSPESSSDPVGLTFQPERDAESYHADVAAIRELIAAGDCYQANYTFPLSAPFSGDYRALYQTITARQRAAYGAFLDTGRHVILSASPELFFRRSASRIETRPMKGTIQRGRYPEEDRILAEQLCNNPKERAENLMIVDLLRNDLGIIAEPGSVTADSLFDLESYPTVHQLTSAISARIRPETCLVDIFRALFPCGSVTGAPKRRSMEILAELEQRPRGAYCGTIGMVGPDGEAVFSVAIRTLVCDRNQGNVQLGVGSGITWDSDPQAEYRECITKGSFASAAPRHGLIESLRVEQGSCPLLERHLERLSWSAGRLGIPIVREHAAELVRKEASRHDGVRKLRLLLAPDGGMEVSSSPVEPDSALLNVAVSRSRVDSADQSLYLKLTDRQRYDQARMEFPDADEVLLVNERGELTEGTYHSLVLRLDGRLVTPPLASGLLPGVMRATLLDDGVVTEQTLVPADLERAGEIWLINAVRGWRRAMMMENLCASS